MPRSMTYVKKEESGSLPTEWNGRVRNEVYNTDSLAWEAQSVTAASNDLGHFARILAKEYLDTEEERVDLAAADIYVGVNTDGTSTATATWKIIRVYLDGSGNPTRRRFRSGVAWDSRTSGWS